MNKRDFQISYSDHGNNIAVDFERSDNPHVYIATIAGEGVKGTVYEGLDGSWYAGDGDVNELDGAKHERPYSAALQLVAAILGEMEH
jgi:hypothetical protein